MLRQLAATLTLAILTAAQAHAMPISGFGDPSMDAALAGSMEINFDAAASGHFHSATFGDVTIGGIGGAYTIGSAYSGWYNHSGKAVYNGFDLRPDALRFDFASAVDGFAFNWGASDNRWLLSAYDGNGNLLDHTLLGRTRGSNRGDYFGLSAGGIAYATLVDQPEHRGWGGDYVFLDNFTYLPGRNSQTAVPEPASLVLMGIGLAGIAVARRKRSKS